MGTRSVTEVERATAEGQRAGIGKLAADDRVIQRQRAGVDIGRAGVSIGVGQDQRARAFFGQATDSGGIGDDGRNRGVRLGGEDKGRAVKHHRAQAGDE